MQTFLPYKNFIKSASCLDRMRLGKQRVEVYQLLRAINNETKGWRNHPAALMWTNYTDALVDYGLAICTEWISRGYKDNCYDKIINYHSGNKENVIPIWLGNKRLHLSHRSNLLRKDFKFYSKFWKRVSPDLDYYWPIRI